jgi:hypothetical protein
MGIEVEWVDEDHNVIQEVSDSKQHVSALATRQWPCLQDTVCLRFIGPFGDCVFNQAQIPILLNELNRSAESLTDPETRAHVAQVCRLVATAMGQPHTYIKFVGD